MSAVVRACTQKIRLAAPVASLLVPQVTRRKSNGEADIPSSTGKSAVGLQPALSGATRQHPHNHQRNIIMLLGGRAMPPNCFQYRG